MSAFGEDADGAVDAGPSEAVGTLSSIVFEVADRGFARTIAGALQNLIEPPPDALSIFEEPGQSAPWRITAYYQAPPDVADLQAGLNSILDCQVPLPRGENVPDLNWVALSQAALPPVVAGRFTVHGEHDRHRVPQGPGALLIEAGEAFGTAHHGTTYGCLLAVDGLTRRHVHRRVLDLGCGSGVLAIAVARANPGARILASDIDAASVAVAEQNARVNRCGNRIEFVCAAGLAHQTLRRGRPYDLLIANILAGPLIGLAKELSAAVAPDGHLVLSGLLNEQAREIVAHYRAAGFVLERATRIAGWTTLVMRKRRTLGECRRGS